MTETPQPEPIDRIIGATLVADVERYLARINDWLEGDE